MNDIRLALQLGIDIPIPECQLIIHQPTMRELAYLGEDNFWQAVQYINVSKNFLSEKDKTDLQINNNFQIFMRILNDKELISKKENIIQLFSLLFPKKKVVVLPRGINLIEPNINPITIDENNFEALQDTLKQIFCLNSKGEFGGYNPANAAAQAIAEKLEKCRQKVAKMKAEQGEEQGSLFCQYISTTVGVLKIPYLDIRNWTVYQLMDTIERHNLYTSWDIDIRSRLAGAKNEEPPANYMKNIH